MDLEELKQSIRDTIINLIRVEHQQFIQEIKAYNKAINKAKEQRVNMFEKRFNRDEVAIHTSTNDIINQQLKEFYNQISNIKIQLAHHKEVRISLKIQAYKYFNRLKTQLDKDKKPNKALKEILLNNNRSYTEWLVTLCYYLLSSAEDKSKEVKQRMNLFLEEIQEKEQSKLINTDNRINNISFILLNDILDRTNIDKRIKNSNNTLRENTHPHSL